MVEEVRRQFNTIPGLMEGTAKPDYATCVKISTDASIKEMIPPGALVMLTPLIVGTLFGVETLSGVLAGALVSGVQVRASPPSTLSVHFNVFACSRVYGFLLLTDRHLCFQHRRCMGQCQEVHRGECSENVLLNTMSLHLRSVLALSSASPSACFIQAGASEHARTLGPKGSDCHKAAVIGDTIGDPLKDTSGPSLNILIKLMAVESLVFAPFFATQGGLLFKYL
jgi:hypothetical protein